MIRPIFLFLVLIIVFIFSIPLIFKVEKIKELVLNKISKEIKQDFIVKGNIDLSFFPDLKIKLPEVLISDPQNKIEIFSERVIVSIKWTDIIVDNFDVSEVIFFSPIIQIDNYKRYSSNPRNFELINANFFLEYDSNNFLNTFKKILIKNGKINYINKYEKTVIIENFNSKISGNSENTFDGNFVVNAINSKFKFNSDISNFKKINVRLSHNFIGYEKEKNEFNGKINYKNKKIKIEGDLKSTFLNFEKLKKEFTQINLPFSENYKNTNLRKNYPEQFEININFKLKKIKLLKNYFDKVSGYLLISNSKVEIINCLGQFMMSKFALNSKYDISEKKLEGIILINDFIIPKYDKNKYYLSDGILSASMIFKHNGNLFDLEKIKKKFLIKGEFNIIEPYFYGLNANKIIQNIKTIKRFNDVFKVFSQNQLSGFTVIDDIKGRFSIEEYRLLLNDVKIDNRDFEIFSNGFINLEDKTLSIKNKVKLLPKYYKDFPSFNFTVSGTSENHIINFDFENFKQKLINESLKNIFKENKKIEINPEDFLDFFDGKKKEKIIDLFLN